MLFVMVLLLEGYLVVDGVVNHFKGVACFVLESVMFAVELHLEAVPGVTV